jgi:radical SAM superfamily enzyme YgiQ (UPF0313 family)
MRALLVQPQTPPTYWGFQHAVKIVGKSAPHPPLGLITLAALLPQSWEMRVKDMNVEPVSDDELLAADVVLVTGMLVHIPNMRALLARTKRLGVRTILGGPAVTTSPDAFPDAEHIFLGEAEGRLEPLLRALEGSEAPRVLSPLEGERPGLHDAPPPRFDLLEGRKYTSMSIQYSRGCPFRCEFCDIIEIFGRVPRTKTPEQVLVELDALLKTGFRGTVFVVDDNFIGNRKLVAKLLPRIEEWQRAHGWPFELYTEASVDLAAMPKLVEAMAAAGFSAVFLGIETPEPASIKEAQKLQNLKIDPAEAVHRLTRAGLEVYAGFIVGFDADGPGIFEAQRNFIASLPIPAAMIGILTALPSTQLWRRLERENRLRGPSSGDQFDRPNFDTAMDEGDLLRGYRELLGGLYTADAYYDRCEKVIDEIGVAHPVSYRPGGLRALLKAAFRIGVKSPRRRHFWRLLRRSLRKPRTFPRAVAMAVQGEHMIRYTAEDVLPRLDAVLQALPRERTVRRRAPVLAVMSNS